MKELFIKGHTISLYAVSPTVIMDYIHNDEHLIKWMSTHVETIYDSDIKDEPIRTGLKYISRQKVGKKIIDIPCEITEYAENKLVNVKSITKEGISYSRYIIEEKEDETLLTLEGSYIPRNWFQAIKLRILIPFTNFVLKEELEQLENYIYDYTYHGDDSEAGNEKDNQ